MLSDEEIDAVWPSPEGTNSIRSVARAIEAEVRKQDEALIQQFVRALGMDRHDTEDWPKDSRNALAALRARLDKPLNGETDA